jgi:hypothetical protein
MFISSHFVQPIAPQQREAVATMKRIQEEAYHYAVKTMKNYTLAAREVGKQTTK